MCQDLDEQISKLRNPRKADLQALISCAVTRLGKSACTSISLLGGGGFNMVYGLSFDDGTAIAASVSLQIKKNFDPRAKLSEFATMEFVRKSGLYPEIVVPEIYAYDTSFSNPVGAPYTLMQLLQGRTYQYIKNEYHLRGLDLLSQADQLAMVKSFAKLQALLCKPVPFSKIGSIVIDESGEFSIGPLFNLAGQDAGGPFNSVEEVWRARLDRMMLKALDEWSGFETDDLLPDYDPCPPQRFSKMYQQLAALIPHFIPPQPYLQLVLYHPDLAFRSVFFDPQDYSRITGVIDWTGAQVLPLMLTAQFPYDIRSQANWPLLRHISTAEMWHTVPCDWTSLANASENPEVEYVHEQEQYDTSRMKTVVRQYYLRQYFITSFADYMQTMYNDTDVSRATLFADALYYMKFNEMVSSSFPIWVLHARWVEETYWRLRLTYKGDRGDRLITGQNVYRISVDSTVCNLGLVEDVHTHRLVDTFDL